jgi:hypothetical protein
MSQAATIQDREYRISFWGQVSQATVWATSPEHAEQLATVYGRDINRIIEVESGLSQTATPKALEMEAQQ